MGKVIFAINLIVVSTVVLGTSLVPRTGRVAVVVSPWSSASRVVNVISTAGGSLVGSSRLIWIAVSEDRSPDYVQRLYAAGALMVLDGSLFAACQGTERL